MVYKKFESDHILRISNSMHTNQSRCNTKKLPACISELDVFPGQQAIQK
jgi:hypothetical protein